MKNTARPFMIGMLILLIIFTLCIASDEFASEKVVTVYVGSCMGGAVSEVAQEFEEENPGVKVELVAKGSGDLLANIGEWKTGDIYMPGEESFAREAVELGYMDDYAPVAHHTLVLIVPEGNPQNITSLDDITDNSVRVVAGSSDIAMGRMCKDAIGSTHEKIADNFVYLEESKCSRIPSAVAGAQADVGISCAGSALRTEGVEIVELKEFKDHASVIPIGVLKFSQEKELAGEFVDLMTSEYGRGVMDSYGFDPVEGR